MPYKSKAERERENWITLPEAAARIGSADGCDEKDARQQLLTALTDGVLGPLRWEREKNDKPSPFGHAPLTVPSDTPPSGRDWLRATIRWKTGMVRDDWSEHKNGKWRVLLILSSKITQYWPSDWERLSDGLARVVATGIDEAQAKRNICVAIAKRRVTIRFRVEREDSVIDSFGEHIAGTVRSGGDVDIPTGLTPSDLNWQQSRPLKPWRDIRRGHSAPVGLWHLEWIELSRAGVSKHLCGGTAHHHERARPASQAKSGPGAKTRGIVEAIDQLWPGGIPKGLSAKERDNAIGRQLRTNGSSVPQNIPRAVQRVLKAQRS